MKFFILLKLLVSNMIVNAQFFEGKILYSNVYKSKNRNLTDAQLGIMVGNIQEYFIKEGNYKSLLNGQILSMQ